MRTSDAVNRDTVSLQSVVMNVAECVCESLVPMRNMTEIALDPIGSRWYVKSKAFGVCDLSGFFGVSCSCKAGDNQLDLRKLCGFSVLLTSPKVDCGTVGKCYDGCMVAGLMY